MIHYILQIIAFKLLFLIAYDLFLKRETFFNWNRAYLLITPILSFLLPLAKIEFIRNHIPPAYSIKLPEILITNYPMKVQQLPEVVIGSEPQVSHYISIIPVLGYLWYIGVAVSFALFIYKISKILKLRTSGTKMSAENITFVSLPDTSTAFSFFNTIYIGNNLSETKKTNVIVHEKIHVQEYHSLDLIFFEILRILFWFNPLIYVYQKRIAMLQEYIADAKAIAETNKKRYYQDLLSQVFQTEKISFINTFFNHSLIKNRLVMLQKSKSKKIIQLRYLFLIPVVCSMLIYTSCTEDSTIQQEKSPTKEEILEEILELSKNSKEITEEQQKRLRFLLEEIKTLVSPEMTLGKMPNTDGIPFALIENVPIYQGCEGLSHEESKKCFSTKIAQFINAEFNTRLAKELNLNGRIKIYSRFKIDFNGNITDIKVRAPLPELETESIRVLKKIPKMVPGSQDNVDVAVLYSLPIIFEVKE